MDPDKAKVCKEENASGILCEESELDQALEEIIDKEKLADEKSSEAKNKEKEEKTAAEERRKTAMERLSQTKNETRKVKPLEPMQKRAEGAPRM